MLSSGIELVTADVVWECIGTSLRNWLYVKYV